MGIFSKQTIIATCTSCSTELKEVELQGFEDLKAVGYGLLLSKSTKVVPMVCPNCGHVDFYAENPSIFNK